MSDLNPNRKPTAHRVTGKTMSKKRVPLRTTPATALPPEETASRPLTSWLYPSLVVISLLLGIFTGYIASGRKPLGTVRADKVQPIVAASDSSNANGNKLDLAALMKQVNPPDGFKLPVRYGDLGPRLIESSAINYDAFSSVYQQAGDPLTQSQVEILKRGSDDQIIITEANAHFLLNFFWAVGLVNENPILTKGAITQYGKGQIDSFASTGGWTLGTKSVKDLFASTELISLTPEQQARLEEVSSAVYRPCCDNPTIFPDCNHGMAMLGLLELMASQNVSIDEMFTAAKYVNAYWFPQQALETAMYLKSNRNIDFAQADPRTVTGKDFFSATGAGRVHVSLQSEGLLPKTPNGGGSCGS